MTVHHIDMDKVGAGSLQRLDLGAEAREIGGKYGRSDANGWGHQAQLSDGFDPSPQGKARS